MGKAVAFFRNLNLGQGWAPTRPQLIRSFEESGATDVVNVQVNGTVIFTHRAPVAATQAVLARLHPLSGYADVAVVRSAPWLRELVARLVDLDLDPDTPAEVSFFDARPPFPLDLPWTAPDGRLVVVAGDHRHAVSTWSREARTGSNGTAVLQEIVGAPVTSRGLETVRRVVARL